MINPAFNDGRIETQKTAKSSHQESGAREATSLESRASKLDSTDLLMNACWPMGPVV